MNQKITEEIRAEAGQKGLPPWQRWHQIGRPHPARGHRRLGPLMPPVRRMSEAVGRPASCGGAQAGGRWPRPELVEVEVMVAAGRDPVASRRPWTRPSSGPSSFVAAPNQRRHAPGGGGGGREPACGCGGMVAMGSHRGASPSAASPRPRIRRAAPPEGAAGSFPMELLGRSKKEAREAADEPLLPSEPLLSRSHRAATPEGAAGSRAGSRQVQGLQL
jgi:hypothetical protein